MSQISSSRSGDQHSSALLRALLLFDRGLGLIERTIVAGSILAMAFLMSAHVVGNIVLGQGIAGTYEITEMLIVVITFVGVGYAARHARHISMSAFYEQLGGQRRKALLVLICLGTALLMFYFSYKSIEYVITLHDRGRTSASLQMPLWIVYLALPIGFALAGIQYVLTVIRNLTSPGIWRSLTEQEDYNDAPLPGSDAEGASTPDDR
ncbi:TRAP transporter small permease [Kushneria phyllosphaerae]|uniref:TRAP transporter small permease protein n=1 Tax=Kushneria phyllosphaerae TaxID=2100822 RepID=A0A2R8CJQ1_9GAMM|nr:TRAP transporter small permease [Kushneria phyllosphaerae]SPJ33093.1 Ectoine/5-hydroxyectoine TRAP transporter small permease protein UehB [Kushneria phyllosphaerae]